MSLPDDWREIEKPGKLDINLFISSDGSAWEYQGQIKHGDPIAPTNCTGLTLESEIRTASDDHLSDITAAFTSEAIGVFKLSLTAEQVCAIIPPADAALNGQRIKLGRYYLAVIDGADRFVIQHGDVWGIR
jgi:hypothetical protein